eukprot:CAMPEP_0179148828 /NCGR_PEP_ID=MMETSP0796-20121207/72055_1 /TAXON_ID=73915 /ORGANISM="Pyrodinium bahamense, Strain pbaha01" /LENGTH=201 /DNA_ID=CAMNT_0020849599 /DNA_START=14 /DNA_END=616 /DNA_ORIENTATION=-
MSSQPATSGALQVRKSHPRAVLKVQRDLLQGFGELFPQHIHTLLRDVHAVPEVQEQGLDALGQAVCQRPEAPVRQHLAGTEAPEAKALQAAGEALHKGQDTGVRQVPAEPEVHVQAEEVARDLRGQVRDVAIGYLIVGRKIELQALQPRRKLSRDLWVQHAADSEGVHGEVPGARPHPQGVGKGRGIAAARESPPGSERRP